MLTLRLNADPYCDPTYPCPEIEWEETLSEYTFQMPNTSPACMITVKFWKRSGYCSNIGGEYYEIQIKNFVAINEEACDYYTTNSYLYEAQKQLLGKSMDIFNIPMINPPPPSSVGYPSFQIGFVRSQCWEDPLILNIDSIIVVPCNFRRYPCCKNRYGMGEYKRRFTILSLIESQTSVDNCMSEIYPEILCRNQCGDPVPERAYLPPYNQFTDISYMTQKRDNKQYFFIYNSVIYLNKSFRTDFKFMLYDILGKNIYSMEIINQDSPTEEINLSNLNLPVGIYYFLILQNNTPVNSGKIILTD